MGRESTSPHQLVMFADMVSTGGDNYKLVPSKPLPEEITPKQAMKVIGGGISRQSVYRLVELGILVSRRPTPGKILITLESATRHREKCKDPEYWEQFRNPSQDSLFSQPS